MQGTCAFIRPCRVPLSRVLQVQIPCLLGGLVVVVLSLSGCNDPSTGDKSGPMETACDESMKRGQCSKCMCNRAEVLKLQILKAFARPSPLLARHRQIQKVQQRCWVRRLQRALCLSQIERHQQLGYRISALRQLCLSMPGSQQRLMARDAEECSGLQRQGVARGMLQWNGGAALLHHWPLASVR